MTVLQIGNFTGIFPRQGAQYLQDNAAQVAKNTKLFSGEVRSWMRPIFEYAPIQEGVVSIFKMHGPGTSTVWCEWTKDTDVVRGPVADASDYRIYYSEDGVCKKTNWELCNDGLTTRPCPRNWLYMGVPAPEGTLSLSAERTPVPGEGEDEVDPENPVYDPDNTENRAYVYTYVSTFGAVKEESAPSQAADVVCDLEGFPVVVSGFEDPPTDHYNITAIRLYRVVTGSSTATYMLVDEFELVDHKFPESGRSLNGVKWENGVYEDSLSVTQLGKELDTLNYTPPPEGLRGLVSMPNGFLAGFTYNQVWFSEPYLPYAWPSDYMLTVDSQIVGLGVYGNTLVVATTAQPYTISGTHPSAMTQEKQPMLQPCVSKQSIAYDQYGVLYASPHGLVALAGGQMDVFTRPIMTRDEWQEYSPTLMVATMYNNMYMCSYSTGNERGMLAIARGDTPAMVSLDLPPSVMHVEYGSGRLYYLNSADHLVYLVDGSSINRMQYEWLSKIFQFNGMTTFSAAKVVAKFEDNTEVIEWNAERTEIIEYNTRVWKENFGKGLKGAVNEMVMNGMCVNGSLTRYVPELADFRSITITFIGDGKEVYTTTVTKEEAFRIPATPAYQWAVKVVGNLDLSKLVLATSMPEVRAA